MPPRARALRCAFIAGAEGTAFYLAGLYHYHYGDAHFEEMVLGLAKNTSRAYTMFVFFPAFMVTGYVLYSAQRWREYREYLIHPCGDERA